MKQYTIIGGVNGVGKSSLSGILRQLLPDMGILIDPNRIAAQEHCDRLTAEKLAHSKINSCLKKGIDFSQETTLSGRQVLQTIQQARAENYRIAAQEHCDRLMAEKLARSKIKNCLKKGMNFSQETTLSGRQTLQTIQQAKAENYRIRLYYVGISSAEESLLRIENRVRKGGHDTPVQDVCKQYERRFADLAKVLPYCDEVHFYDNENGFQAVAFYQNGTIFPLTDRLPQWMRDFIAYQKQA